MEKKRAQLCRFDNLPDDIGLMDFPVGSDGRNPLGILETWVRSLGWDDPQEEHGNPLQYSCLELPMDRGAWWCYSPWGHKEPDMAECPTL